MCTNISYMSLTLNVNWLTFFYLVRQIRQLQSAVLCFASWVHCVQIACETEEREVNAEKTSCVIIFWPSKVHTDFHAWSHLLYCEMLKVMRQK
jgi:hypothetical protein